MTKYEILTDRAELHLRCRAKSDLPAMTPDEIFNAYRALSVQEPETVETYDNLEEARESFRMFWANYGSTRAVRGSGLWFLDVELAWIEAMDYDEDGNLDQSCGTYDLSAEGYWETAEPDEIDRDAARRILERVPMDTAAALMDDDLREEINRDLAPCEDVDFLSAYIAKHHAKFGEWFTV